MALLWTAAGTEEFDNMLQATLARQNLLVVVHRAAAGLLGVRGVTHSHVRDVDMVVCIHPS
jgi:hypothetical protein